jgi:hypothetical protein
MWELSFYNGLIDTSCEIKLKGQWQEAAKSMQMLADTLGAMETFSEGENAWQRRALLRGRRPSAEMWRVLPSLSQAPEKRS